MSTERILIIIEGQDKGASAALKGLQTNLTGADAAAGKAASGGISSLFGKLAGAGILLQAGQMALQFGKDSLQAASDAEEAGSKFDTVFKENAPAARTELEAFGDAANRSGIEMQGMAANIQDTLVPMGIARDEAAGLSVDVVKLAADLGSFNNMPMDEALKRLQGTLVGSHENALAFGVVINENTLKAELAAQGWDKLTGAQLESAKVQARLNLLYAGTTDAQGDAIRTADSYANTQAGLEAATLDLQVALGSLATEGLADVTRGTTTLVNNLTDLVGWIGKVEAIAGEHNETVALSSATYEDYAAEVVRVAVETGKLNEKQAQIVLATFRNADANTELSGTMKQVGAEIGLMTNAERVQFQQTEALARAYEAAGVSAYTWIGASGEQTEALTTLDHTLIAAEQDTLAMMDATGGLTDTVYEAYVNSEKFADRLMLVNEKAVIMTDAMHNAKPPVDELMDSLDQDIQSPLENIISDLQFLIASGGQDFTGAFAGVQEALAAGKITPEQAQGFFAELLAETENVKIAMGEITFDQAAANIAETLNIPLEEAVALLNDVGTAAETIAGMNTVISMDTEPVQNVYDILANMEGSLNNIDGTHNVNINIHTNGTIPSLPSGPGGSAPGSSQNFQSGGIVPGTFLEPIPAVVHGGEMVLNPGQQQRLFALLNGEGASGGLSTGSAGGAPVVYVYIDGRQITEGISYRLGRQTRQEKAAR